MGDDGGAREERRQEGGNLPREWGNAQRERAGRRGQELGAYILSHGNEKSREGATRHGNQLHAGDDTGGHTGPARISVERARAKKKGGACRGEARNGGHIGGVVEGHCVGVSTGSVLPVG